MRTGLLCLDRIILFLYGKAKFKNRIKSLLDLISDANNRLGDVPNLLAPDIVLLLNYFNRTAVIFIIHICIRPFYK